MSDNIPFEIQMEIIKKVSDVKSLVQFRSVCKPWKSFIDSSEFIKGYGARHSQPHSRIVSYKVNYSSDLKFICLVDDDNETFKVQQQEFVVSPLLKQFRILFVVGACHGLLCFVGLHKVSEKWMVIIWNPCIGKSFGIGTQSQNIFGFGVCPITRDPMVVRILCADNMPWHVEVFSLSSGIWNVIPCSKLPRESIKLTRPPTQVVIDRFIYWGAWEKTFTDDGESTINHMVVSFDLITKEFKVVDLPNSLKNELCSHGVMGVSVSRLRGSLVVYGDINADEGLFYSCGVWMMENDSSFRKLFTIGAHVSKILGFSKIGETIFVTATRLNVYDPCSQQIKNLLGIYGVEDSFFMGSYKESLLLLDHLDSRIYYDNNQSK